VIGHGDTVSMRGCGPSSSARRRLGASGGGRLGRRRRLEGRLAERIFRLDTLDGFVEGETLVGDLGGGQRRVEG